MPGAVIFDLDGTLTVPSLDFDAIRREIGLDGGPILEALARMGDADRTKAEVILDRHEHRAALESQLNAGAAETLTSLQKAGYPVASLTRNATKWTNLVLEKHDLRVDAMRTRDDGAIKPSARPLLDLCIEPRCEPSESWMVGDYLFDILSGKQAGCTTVLMVGQKPLPDYHPQADCIIRRLPELLPLVAAANR